MRRLFCISIALALTAASASAVAQETTRTALPATGALGAIAGLGIVVALIFGIGWLMRRLGGASGFQRGPLRVLGAASVGQRERVVVVRYQDSILVLGVAQGHVTLLKETPAPADGGVPTSTQAPSFLARLRAAGGAPHDG